LFVGTGRPLELEVKAALEALGATVTEPAPNRDDWLAEFPGVDAVVEVEGVEKSGAEKHAAQLEKWVAGRFEKTGNAPKGILVVNAWRDVPLPKLTSAAWRSKAIASSRCWAPSGRSRSIRCRSPSWACTIRARRGPRRGRPRAATRNVTQLESFHGAT